MSRQSGQSGSYTGLIGFNPRRLKGPKRGMSSHATDLRVYAKSSSSSRSSESTRIDPPPTISYQRSIATIDLSRTVSEINGDFSRKSYFSTHPAYFASLLKRFALELGVGAGSQKTRVMGLPSRTRSLTISTAVWIQSTSGHFVKSEQWERFSGWVERRGAYNKTPKASTGGR